MSSQSGRLPFRDITHRNLTNSQSRNKLPKIKQSQKKNDTKFLIASQSQIINTGNSRTFNFANTDRIFSGETTRSFVTTFRKSQKATKATKFQKSRVSLKQQLTDVLILQKLYNVASKSLNKRAQSVQSMPNLTNINFRTLSHLGHTNSDVHAKNRHSYVDALSSDHKSFQSNKKVSSSSIDHGDHEGDSKNSETDEMSWSNHLSLLKEYDQNRVLLQELTDNIKSESVETGQLLSDILQRNDQIKENLSHALGYERNRIDKYFETSNQLKIENTTLNEQLSNLQHKFSTIKDEIQTFNNAQQTHKNQLNMAQKFAKENKEKCISLMFENHQITLSSNLSQQSFQFMIKHLTDQVNKAHKELAKFKGQTIQQLFTNHEKIKLNKNVSKSTQHARFEIVSMVQPSTILLITGLSSNITITKIKNLFATISCKNVTDPFPSIIFHPESDRSLLPHAVLAEFNSVDDATLVKNLLNNRIVGSRSTSASNTKKFQNNKSQKQQPNRVQVIYAKEFPSQHVTVQTSNNTFKKEHLLHLYSRYARVVNITQVGYSYILKFETLRDATIALINTSGRKIFVESENNTITTSNTTDTVKTRIFATIDIAFANDVKDIVFDNDEPNLSEKVDHLMDELQQVAFKLDFIENDLSIEYYPDEPSDKREERLKTLEKMQPPNLSVLDNINFMLRNQIDKRIKGMQTEIDTLKIIAKGGNEAMRHIRKYIDPTEPTYAEYKDMLKTKADEMKKMSKTLHKFKTKCTLFDKELQKSKEALMDMNIKYQILKRMKRGSKGGGMFGGYFSENDIDDLDDEEDDNGNQTDKPKKPKQDPRQIIQKLSMELEIAKAKIEQYRNNDSMTGGGGPSEVEQELHVQVAMLKDEIKEKNADVSRLESQVNKLKDEIKLASQMGTNGHVPSHDPSDDMTFTLGIADGSKNGNDTNDTQLKTKLMKVQKELSMARKKLSVLESNNSGNANNINELIQENERLKKQLLELERSTIASPDTNTHEDVSNITDVGQLQEKCTEYQTKISDLKKNNKQLDAVLKLKTIEYTKLEQQVIDLKKAKDMCEALHSNSNTKSSSGKSISKNSKSKKSKAKNGNTSGGASTSKTDDSKTVDDSKLNVDDDLDNESVMLGEESVNNILENQPANDEFVADIQDAKLQEKISQLISARDNALAKLRDYKDRVDSLSRKTKKLKKENQELKKSAKKGSTKSTVSKINGTSSQLKDSDENDYYKPDDETVSVSRMSNEANPRAKSESSLHRRKRPVADAGANNKQGDDAPTGATQKRLHTTGDIEKRHLDASDSLKVDTNDDKDFTHQELQNQINRLRDEVSRWKQRAKSRSMEDRISMSRSALRSTRQSKTSDSDSKRKALMVNKRKPPTPKAARMVEKKWKMTKSRFLKIAQSEAGQRPLKTLRWLIKTIDEIYDCKYKSDQNCMRENREKLKLPEFLYHTFLPSRFGIKKLVDAMCWDIHNAVQNYSNWTKMEKKLSDSSTDPISEKAKSRRLEMEAQCQQVATFQKFLEEDMGPDDLSFYLKARDGLNKVKLSLIDSNGMIPLAHLSSILDSVFESVTQEARCEIVMRLQALSLYETPNSTLIHKETLLNHLLKENQNLLHIFGHDSRLLYFYFNLNSKSFVNNDDNMIVAKYIMASNHGYSGHGENSGAGGNTDGDTAGNRLNELLSHKIESLSDAANDLKPFNKFCLIMNDLFDSQKQIILPTFAYNNTLYENNTIITQLVNDRWSDSYTNLVVPINDVFSSYFADQSEKLHKQAKNSTNLYDLFTIQKLIAKIHDYCNTMKSIVDQNLGWNSFLSYSQLLSTILVGFELLDQLQLKNKFGTVNSVVSTSHSSHTNITNNSSNSNNSDVSYNITDCLNSMDSYLYSLEEFVMKRFKRVVVNPSMETDSINSSGNYRINEFLHLNPNQL